MAKYVDLLDEDKPIAEQKFACLSFISPDYIIKKKELFFFENFVKQYNFNKSMELMTQFINFVSYKYNIDSTKVFDDYKEFVENERAKLEDRLKTILRILLIVTRTLQEQFCRTVSKQMFVVLKYAEYSQHSPKQNLDVKC